MIREKPAACRPKNGFSLIELAVVLAISAAIGLTLWRLLPALRASGNSAGGGAAEINLLTAQQALDGYVLQNGRLPRPDIAGTGFEDTTGSAAVGMLPYRTLGLGSDPTLRYGVYRKSHATPTLDADLAVALPRYVPLLPVPSGVPANGLDFCVALKNGMANPAALTAGSQAVPVAYALAHAGANGTFDGLNSSPSNFELTARAQSPTYDDRVQNTGLAELFGRVNCHERLSAAEGAAREAFAAFDVDRSAALYQDFRTFAVRTRTNSRDFAIASLVISVADITDTVAAGVTAIAIAAQTAGLGVGVVAGAVIPALAAAAALAAATAALVSGEMALQKAELQKAAADVFRDDAARLYSIALARVRTVKRKGLLP